jgi:hypothetical protein
MNLLIVPSRVPINLVLMDFSCYSLHKATKTEASKEIKITQQQQQQEEERRRRNY